MKKQNYRVIKSGNNQRREYFSRNHSPLFAKLPKIDTAQEQKKSFFGFLNGKLKDLLDFYFPVKFSDHNNVINIEVINFNLQEPEITEKEASINSLSWNYKLFLNWKSDWECYGINIDLEEKKEDELDDYVFLEKNIVKWVEKSFKVGPFVYQQISPEKWEIKEKKGTTCIIIELKERKESCLFVSFRYLQEKEILFCHLPKINEQGTFIINGHYKVAVCQSVRSPAVYCFFSEEQKKFYSEIIPAKGSWISVSFNYLVRRIELKFLNSKKIVGLREILDHLETPLELVDLLLLGSEDKEKSSEKKKVVKGGFGSKFLFSSKNSYFEFGRLGRKKFNQKMLLRNRLLNQVLAEDICNEEGKVVLTKGTFITTENIVLLENLLKKGINSLIGLPTATSSISQVKINSSRYPEQIISVIGIVEELSLSKVFFDLADLFCVISYYINVQHGVGNLDLEEEKDKLDNQVIRRIGDLLYNMFDSKLGGFLYQDMSQKYLANISQLKKTDLAKMPNLKEFDSLLKSFFNTSPLVQLQNQNNPLSEIAYTRKVSVLGLGGFNVNNITLTARNVDESHYGRFGLMSTQEGKNFGLTHSLALEATINEDGQVAASFFRVEKGFVKEQLIYLTSDDEQLYYIAHCNIHISEDNEILDKEVLVRYQKKIISVKREAVQFIDSSFFHLTSVEESMGPFTPYNDATRTLMTSNMQRGAIASIKNEEPLIATGVEETLRNNSFLTVVAEEEGTTEYVDNQKIVILNKKKEKKTYLLNQSYVSNKDILNFSFPLVKKKDKVKKGQLIADGHYSKNGELSLGCNLRVAYISYDCNFEDAIIFSDRLIKQDIFTYVTSKEYNITRFNTSCGPEIFSSIDVFSGQKVSSLLDEEGIIKVGSVVNSGDLLVRKLTPQLRSQESEEEMLLFKILGGKGQKYVNSSLRLPKHEIGEGVVYKVEKKVINEKDELESVKICIAFERKIEDGDKVTARYGNKGIIKIMPEADMPYTEEGPFDMILNPLGVPSRMNVGQLLETLLAEAAFRLKTKFLIRPFNTINLEDVKEIAEEAGITDLGNRLVWNGKTGVSFVKKIFSGRLYVMMLNHKSVDKIHARATGPYSMIFQQPLKGRKRDGGQRIGEMEGWCLEAHGAAKTLLRMYSSDDIKKRNELQNYLFFNKRKFNLMYNKSESFNLVLQYLRGIGFNLEATDFQGKNVDFFKYFSE